MRGVCARLAGVTLVGVFTLVAAAGCGSSSSGGDLPRASGLSVTGGQASIGHLTITRAYIPDPATPSIAAAYFTVTNSGPADRLLSIDTPNFRSALLNRYVTDPRGAESMVAIRGGAVIPAHGRFVLTPGSYHVMLMKPLHPLAQGTTTRLRLHFADAGVVSMVVPVVADTGLPGSTSSGQDMPGMNMSGGGM